LGPNFVLHISSCLDNDRLYTKNWLCNLPGIWLKVPVVGGGLQSEYSDRLLLSFSLALAKPNDKTEQKMGKVCLLKRTWSPMKVTKIDYAFYGSNIINIAKGPMNVTILDDARFLV
jgi:hypothetical protein